MAGNKKDNGVWEQGTDDIRCAYQDDTPGQKVESFIKEDQKTKKESAKKHFGQVFNNPLKGYPYNEAIKVTEKK